MTLRSKLIFSTSVEVLLVVLASLSLINSSHQTNRIIDKEAKAIEIVETVSQIRFVTFEYLLYENERSYEQWQSKHDHLVSLLQSDSTKSPEEQQILESILQDSRDVSLIFDRLATGSVAPSLSESFSDDKAYKQRLATRLLAKQQSQISAAFKLTGMAREEAVAQIDRTNSLVWAVILFMFTIMAVNFFFIAGTITKALKIFQEGAEKIADGKFDYRISVGNRIDELGRLAIAFNSMAGGLEQVDKVKEDLILLASHQLRTPLTSIKWSSEALITPSANMTAERQQHYINQIHDSNERMIGLVNELLSATKIGLGTSSVNPRLVDLPPVLKQALNDLSTLIQDNKITIVQKLDEGLTAIWIDPTWMSVILQNLLSNAIKYSPEGESVSISIRQKPDHVLIEVADKGCGIPDNQQDKIFTKLFRADNARRIIGEGSGLGLYITKALVEQFNGKIWFESVENQGTTFYVKLPIEKP